MFKVPWAGLNPKMSGRTQAQILVMGIVLCLPGLAGADQKQGDARRQAVELNNRGVAALNAGEFVEAIDLLRQATEISPDETYVQNLSIAMNNLAVQNLADTKPDQAISLLTQAMAIFPSDMIAKNLGEAFIMKGRMEEEEGRPELAEEFFQDAVKADPVSTDAYRWLAQNLYDGGKLGDALSMVRKAQKIKDSPELRNFAEKIQREHEGEKNFFEYRGMHFKVSYSPAIPPSDVSNGAWALERAYQEHRMFLGEAPKGEIRAVFYSSKDAFTSTHDLTQNVAGIYDGKVRLPVPEKPNWEALGRTISHEVAHAFLFDVGGPDIPLWLNEGLAEFLSGGPDRPTPSLDETRRKKEPLIPIVDLSASLRNLKNNTKASLAYDEAYSLAKFIHERFGVFGIRRLLQTFKQGTPSESEAIHQSLFMTPEILQQSWEGRLR